MIVLTGELLLLLLLLYEAGLTTEELLLPYVVGVTGVGLLELCAVSVTGQMVVEIGIVLVTTVVECAGQSVIVAAQEVIVTSVVE